MKKLLLFISVFFIVAHSTAKTQPKIDDQLLQNFSIQFPHAQNVVWNELEDSYVVSFIEDGIRLRIVYLRNGSLIHYLRYYLEENLPLEIRLNVKKQFPAKDIYGIIEENIVSTIEGKSRTTYYVKLEDETGWLTVKVERNRKMKIIEKLIKNI